MELLQLQYFRTVARMEHMTRAAQELRIAQPALSKTIARLEDDVGVPLFDRQNGRIRLNAFGRAFLHKVDAALTLLEEAKQEVAELAGLEQGSIRISTSTLTVLTEPIREFLNLHPNVNMQITHVSSQEEMAASIESGEADIGFSVMPADGDGVAQARVMSEELFLVVPRKHRLAKRTAVRLADAAGEPFVGYKEGFVVQETNEALFRQAGIAPRIVCRVDEPAAILSLVRAGLGVALFGCVSPDDSELVYLPIERPVCRRDYWLVWTERRYLSLAARKFIEFVIHHFTEESRSAG
ncbi:MAG: LysR family transcriptional regulator [Paenibacillaceae bacterium]|nr:MAG: LysR family transcriptional regulator [Paenibacillaceae bacterium]